MLEALKTAKELDDKRGENLHKMYQHNLKVAQKREQMLKEAQQAVLELPDLEKIDEFIKAKQS